MAQLKDGPGEGESVVVTADLSETIAVPCDDKKIAGMQAKRLAEMEKMGLFNRAA
ncbi:MAG: hypothetical protein WC843_03815 [Candidatus Gracilibacteria bacterium]|jgi:hypothetical protein